MKYTLTYEEKHRFQRTIPSTDDLQSVSDNKPASGREEAADILC